MPLFQFGWNRFDLAKRLAGIEQIRLDSASVGLDLTGRGLDSNELRPGLTNL